MLLTSAPVLLDNTEVLSKLSWCMYVRVAPSRVAINLSPK
jgi:hypothetical protein